MNKEYYEIRVWEWKNNGVEGMDGYDKYRYFGCKNIEDAQKIYDNLQVSENLPQIELWHIIEDEEEGDIDTRIKMKDELGEYENE